MRPDHGGKALGIIDKENEKLENIIEFSANINPLSMDFKKIIIKSIDRIKYYPDDNYTKLKSSISLFHDSVIPSENITIGTGSIEIIKNFSHAVLEKGDKILIFQPTFMEYEYFGKIFGANPIFVEYNKLIRESNLIDIKKNNIKVIFLCNPNNPTGTLIKKDKVNLILDFCNKEGSYLFIDEAFIELSQPEESLVKDAVKDERLFVLRSLTKCFSIPGLRVGYGIGSRSLIDKIDAVRIPWNVGCIESEVASYLLKNGKTFLEESRRFIKSEREWLEKELSNLGLKTIKSDSNFLMINIEPLNVKSSELTAKLAKKGIIVRDCSTFRFTGDSYIRVAIRNRKDNKRLIYSIKEIR
ncbi:MAG: histidinol-phosphate aminotransferase family protein [Candidatus Methanoliparum thermophilum]|uniref:Aminotransferase n=1 Tax=Methanoliparum thermophilum TaxID=2491083 RepID=A0A520KU36_METT2|nr:histidinol-phosphate transaminase [Candidatus Methanoliparum sp. LAM-1]RZN65632.1 MAG: histidinol-phosphate aminotransferase family protein [Candidatus Methanoliparum thermophilum]BDC36515.1 hypothetical protein MTLP_11970 [Candidatus Methanoliparum sp. LAM-1]